MTNAYIDIVSQYIDNPVDDISKLYGGHINQSLLIRAGTCKYVLQCLSPAIKGESLRDLESNYIAYREACEADAPVADSSPCGWECPEWIDDRDGQFFHKDMQGKIWRLYRYIDGDALTPGEPYEAGLALGRIHRILKNCDPGDIHPVFPNLHNLKHYYEEYLTTECVRSKRDPELEDVIEQNATEMLGIPVLTDSVIHGDAKVSNMIMRDGHVVGFIDLDTIMTGSVFDDIADCTRSCCVDENYNSVPDKVASLLNGYSEATGMEITNEVAETAEYNLIKNIFMLGLRYYTDYLAGNKYFVESMPGDNLKKARRLLKGNKFML